MSFVSPGLCFSFADYSPLAERRLCGPGMVFCTVLSIHDFQSDLSPLDLNSALAPRLRRVRLSHWPSKECSLPRL